MRHDATGSTRDARAAGPPRDRALSAGPAVPRRRPSTALGAALAALCLTAAPARGVDLRFDPSLLGQVLRGYSDSQTQTPTEIYGDLGLSGLRHGTTLDGYFRLEENFSQQTSATDFFSGVLRIPGAVPGLDLQLGRQIVAESPMGLWDADSGQIRLALPQTPYSMTLYGGQPRYWEPTYGPPVLSQDEQIFGTSLRMASLRGGALSLGFLQQMRQGNELMQQVTLSGTRSFADLPGMPSAYGNFAFDADRANVDRVRIGAQSDLGSRGLLLNLEGGYYKPQDNGRTVVADLDRREDPIFQLFSVSDLLQFRGGLRRAVTPTVSAYVDLSYQRYQELADSSVNGYVWSAGTLYLPGGDGLEMVRLEYYGIDSGGGNVNGGRLYYENRVYEDILFRAKCDVAYYDKATNQSGVAIGSLVGVGYRIAPGLVAELNFEANRNQFFPEDYRVGFFLAYAAEVTTRGDLHAERAGGDGRPWPWAPAQTGNTAWGTEPVRWGGSPQLPQRGWAAPTFAAIADTPDPSGVPRAAADAKASNP